MISHSIMHVAMNSVIRITTENMKDKRFSFSNSDACANDVVNGFVMMAT